LNIQIVAAAFELAPALLERPDERCKLLVAHETPLSRPACFCHASGGAVNFIADAKLMSNSDCAIYRRHSMFCALALYRSK
jgi:hypothetical protein